MLADTVTHTLQETADQQKRLIKILSIDGGGIRGIIPALFLKELETYLTPGIFLTDYFDVIAGTSTGGIIALLLSLSGKDDKPHYKAGDIVRIYEEFGKTVFSRSLWQVLKSGGGLWDAKYSAKNLETCLHSYFKKSCLKHALTNVIVPAYEVELDKVMFYKSFRAKTEQKQDCLLKDLARAASAAPTYFRPATFVNREGHFHTFVDGGIAVNNPTLSAIVHALEIFGENVDFMVVSLGTGTNFGARTKHIKKEDITSAGILGWGDKIVSVMMNAVSEVTDDEMISAFNKHHIKKYHRFQPILEAKHMNMDCVDENNIEALKKYARELIERRKKDIQTIAEDLNPKKATIKVA